MNVNVRKMNEAAMNEKKKQCAFALKCWCPVANTEPSTGFHEYVLSDGMWWWFRRPPAKCIPTSSQNGHDTTCFWLNMSRTSEFATICILCGCLLSFVFTTHLCQCYCHFVPNLIMLLTRPPNQFVRS